MFEKMKNLWKDEEGATAVEYGVMVAIIAAGIIVTVGLLKDKLVETFEGVTAVLPGK